MNAVSICLRFRKWLRSVGIIVIVLGFSFFGFLNFFVTYINQYYGGVSLLYGCESWTMNKAMHSKLEAMEL